MERAGDSSGHPGRGVRRGISILKDYIRPKRALRPSHATVRFETAPGVQLQHDWGQVETVLAGKRRRVDFAVNKLGFSRRFNFIAAPQAARVLCRRRLGGAGVVMGYDAWRA